MKKRKYFYVVSFTAQNNNGRPSTGSIQLYLEYKIKDIPTFNALLLLLREKNDFKTIVITNIMYIGRVWV